MYSSRPLGVWISAKTSEEGPIFQQEPFLAGVRLLCQTFIYVPPIISKYCQQKKYRAHKKWVFKIYMQNTHI